MRAKNNRSSERKSLQREILPLPSAEQLPRSWEIPFLFVRKTDNHSLRHLPNPRELLRARAIQYIHTLEHQDHLREVREIDLHHEARWRTRHLHRCSGSAYATVHATAVKNLSGDVTASDVATLTVAR